MAQKKPKPEKDLLREVAPGAASVILADLALRAGDKLLKGTVHRTILKPAAQAAAGKVAKGKGGIAGRLVSAALVRVATRSVPGAIVVGGGLLAKTVYDHHKARKARKAEEAATSPLLTPEE